MTNIERAPAKDWRWYVAQLRPNYLHNALRNLTRQGIETFNPTHTMSKQKGNRFQKRTEQLFPGYLFVSLDPNGTAWRKVNSTYGVSRLIAAGNRPQPVPDALISDLLLRCDADGSMRPLENLSEGDRIRIASGPLANFVTEIDKIDRNRRIWVLLDILGRKSSVSLERADFELV